MKKYIRILFLSLLTLSIYAQNKVIEIDTIYTNVDFEKKLILINKNLKEINTLYPENKSVIKSGSHQYTFVSTVTAFKYGQAYKVTDSNNANYNLYFTQLPIINISTANTIVDELRVSARFNLCESDGTYLENRIGIEYRGASSQRFEKKSYRIEFWNDTTGDETIDLSLLEMRNDDDWNIQAMYNEPLRLRSKVNFDMWQKIDTLHYINEEPKAINGVQQKYVELFFNKHYRGLYALSERIDRKQLKLKKYKNDEIRGELYKGIGRGASTYTSLPAYDNNNELWGGFEYKYPNEEINWKNIYEFVEFVIYKDDTSFYDNYSERFDIDNAVNYYIFLNLLRATDNAGKNLYVAKYTTNEPCFYIPWDLDGTYGIIWNGKQENITNDILSNGLYKRLIKDHHFTDKLKGRWNILRKDIITVDSIMSDFNTQFNYLHSNAVYERENIAWPNCKYFDLDNLDYTSNWLTNRLQYLDSVFNKTLSTNNISQIKQIKVYPNPANNYINIELQPGLIIKKIQIINSLGQVLYIKTSKIITENIDVSNLTDGVYFMILDFNSAIRKIEKILIDRK